MPGSETKLILTVDELFLSECCPAAISLIIQYLLISDGT